MARDGNWLAATLTARLGADSYKPALKQKSLRCIAYTPGEGIWQRVAAAHFWHVVLPTICDIRLLDYLYGAQQYCDLLFGLQAAC